ncbi:MAG TPA: GDP-mannose 4,6-dehydratase, partial [Bacteroidia bacterium]|nr:GDP-mannose 4,6-dehydratase [Bacteroidia bacterium]
MRILVTGGLGFIGSHFVRCALGASGVVRIVNLDLVTYAADPGSLDEFGGDPRYEFARGDICDGALLAGLFEQHRFDAVVHFAAETHVDRSIDSPEAFVRTNVHGTWQLLESARLHLRSLPEARAGDRF